MQRHPTNKSRLSLWIAVACVVTGVLATAPASGREADSRQDVDAPCAVLKDFAGEVEVLDSSRLSLINIKKSSGIPCGGWVSINRGWASLKHRDGHQLRLGPNTFIELPEDNRDGLRQGDELVLYRGQVWAETQNGSPELRVITANGRARLKDASGILLFSQGEQETQFIVLRAGHSASLENRFESSRIAQIHSGEASSLNFGLLRTVPSQPRTVSVASLRGLFTDLHAAEWEKNEAYAAVRERQDRKFASELTPDENERKPATDGHWTAVVDEAPRAVKKAPGKKVAKGAKKPHTYVRHTTGGPDGHKLRKHWVNRMTAGEPVGERILFPDKYYGRPQSVKVEVTDPDAVEENDRHKQEDSEKNRLIEELSQIRED